MNWYRIKSFLSFYLRAVTKFNVQSPFLFDFVTNVLDTDKSYYIFEEIENQRKRLLQSKNNINFIDFGAGSSILQSCRKSIADMAKSALSGKSKCKILFNLALSLRSKKLIELGTSLGISSSYLAAANKNSILVTLEGDSATATIAKDVHESLGLKNITIKEGNFSKTLQPALKLLNTIDLAFIDGHHLEQPTLEYYRLIAGHCHNNSVIIIDDIYWSQGMNNAWNSIISNPEVTLSIDLFDVGIIFFKKELSKENISYIPYHFKPWRIGLLG